MERVEPVVLVSGGGSGIGRATARALAEGGTHVVILGRRPEVLEAAAQEIEAEVVGSSIRWRQADVTDPETVEAVAANLGADYGAIDAVVNCVGGRVETSEAGVAGAAASWRAAFDRNVLTAVLLTTAVTPLLRRPGGRIVVVSSTASRTGDDQAEYVATKGSLNAWVLALAAQLGPEGITANAVAPGYPPEANPFAGPPPHEIKDLIVSRMALQRPARSEDVAGVIRFLLSPDASFVTGQLIEVAGGSLT